MIPRPALRLLLAVALLAPLAATTSEAAAQTPPPGPEAEGLPAAVPAPWDRDDLIRVVDHPEEEQLEVAVGPVALEPGLPHYRAPVQAMRWPFEGWLRGYSWAVVDARGDTLPSGALHHLGIIDPGRRHLFSPIAQRLVSAGDETESQRLPRLLGVPMSEGSRLLVVGMFANPTDRRIEEATLRIRLDYTRKEGSVLPRMEVRPFYLDVMGPVGPKSFEVPPGRTVKSWEASPAVDARILGVGGHAHDFARRLTLLDVTTGDTVWSAVPGTRGDGHVVDVPEETFLLTAGRRLRADHTYRAEIVYENPTDEPAPHGGMGVIAGVAWTDEADWPALDRRDAAYRADLWNTVTAPARAARRPGGHGHGPLSGTAPGEVRDTLEWKARLAADGDAWPEDVFGGEGPFEGAAAPDSAGS